MWVFIMLAMFLAVLGSFFYVTRRISQFRFMERVSKGRKWLRILESLVPVLAMFGVLWYHGNDGCPHMYDPSCHHLAFM